MLIQENILICDCNSVEHQIVLRKDEDLTWLEIHLIYHQSFFKRFWIGLKYIFRIK